MTIFEYKYIENQYGNNSVWFYSIIAVVIGFLLNYLSSKWERRKNIIKTGNVYDFNLESLKYDFTEQMNELTKYLEGLKDFKDPILEFDALYSFDFIDKIDFQLLIVHFDKQDYDNPEDHVNFLYNHFNLGKNSIRKLPDLADKYDSDYLEFEDKYYDYIIKFERSMKLYIDSKKGQVDQFDNGFGDIVRKYLNGKYSLDECIKFDGTLTKELSEHAYAKDIKHPLYNPIVDFIDESHLLVMRIMSTRNLLVGRIVAIHTDLLTVYHAIFGEKFVGKTQEELELEENQEIQQ